MEAGAGLLVLLVVALISLAVYFLPTIIAVVGTHHNAGAILVLNLFLGWTFLGWVVALVWACTQSDPRLRSTQVARVQQPQQMPVSAPEPRKLSVKCPGCSHFISVLEEFVGGKVRCGNCGRKFVSEMPTFNELKIPSNLGALIAKEERNRKSRI
jgi:ribosomal protein S27E